MVHVAARDNMPLRLPPGKKIHAVPRKQRHGISCARVARSHNAEIPFKRHTTRQSPVQGRDLDVVRGQTPPRRNAQSPRRQPENRQQDPPPSASHCRGWGCRNALVELLGNQRSRSASRATARFGLRPHQRLLKAVRRRVPVRSRPHPPCTAPRRQHVMFGTRRPSHNRSARGYRNAPSVVRAGLRIRYNRCK